MLAVLAAALLAPHASDGIGLVVVPEPAEKPKITEIIPSTFTAEHVLGPFDPGFDWDEMVPSWNLQSPATITVQAALAEPGPDAKWYSFGSWTARPTGPRASVKGQKDDLAEVQTDTLVLSAPRRKVWLRVELGWNGEGSVPFPFVSLSFRNTKASRVAEFPLKRVWGKVIEAPRKSQMSYEGGKVWCSPTCVSMMLAHWARALNRPEWDKDVPEIVGGVHDPLWPGTGNWPFNTAFAGSLRGMRAYVARLAAVTELEEWIEADFPVVVSVSSALLKGRPKKEPNDGHLVVLVGFDRAGDPVFNDPGRSVEIRQTYNREHFERAWAASGNTVYLIYPAEKRPPDNRRGHWAP
jgi:hypothetical protein